MLDTYTLRLPDHHPTATRHQPRLGIWRLLRKVLVLSKGRQLFFGTPSSAEEWFTAGLGLAMPPDTTPVDFIVDQVNIDFDKTGIYGEDYQAQGQRPLVTVKDLDEVRVLTWLPPAFVLRASSRFPHLIRC